MPMQVNARGVKTRQKTYWDAAAGHYDESFTALFAPATEILVEELRLAPGNMVLNPACGTGNESVIAARAVGPTGQVVGVDISPGMVAMAEEKGKRHGLGNLRFIVGDAEKIADKNETYDAVVSQGGLMYFPDPKAALADWYRVLKPGGRIAIGVVGRMENSTLFLLPGQVYARMLPGGVVADMGPNPFAFAAEGVLDAALRKAGFSNVWSKRYTLMITTKDPEIVWDLFVKGSAGFNWRFNQESPETQERVREEVRAQLRAHGSDEGIRLTVELVSSGGYKPREGGTTDSLWSDRTFEQYVNHAQNRIPGLNVDQVAGFKTSGLVLDVRQLDEFAAGHIEGARSVPRGALEAEIVELAPDTRTPILCICDDGSRSALAAQTLSEFGYRRAAWLAGGIKAWSASGGALASGGSES